MIVPGCSELVLERQDLFRKLDKKYDSEALRESDELRIGEIEKEIAEKTKFAINQQKKEVIKKFEQVILTTEKDARKMRKEKRDIYKELAKDCYILYLELVEKKKVGVELEDKLKSKNKGKYDLKKTIQEVRLY